VKGVGWPGSLKRGQNGGKSYEGKELENGEEKETGGGRIGGGGWFSQTAGGGE